MSSSCNSSDGDESVEFDSDYEYESSSDNECPNSEEDKQPSSLFNQEPVPCSICFDDRVEEGCALTLPSCLHSFCINCFTMYIETQIGEGNADSITCPFILDSEESSCDGSANIWKQCKASVGMDVLHEIMAQEKYDKLRDLKDMAFVRKNVDYHHCPTPDCSNVVLCKSIDNENENEARICDCFKCGQTSCLTCGAAPFHTDKTCDEYRDEEHRKREREREERARRMRHQSGKRHQSGGWRPPQLDRSRANDETKFDFYNNSGVPEDVGNALADVKRCRRCGNGVELKSGCLKMKCICGYRFCYQCGSENALCGCTPAHHGFTDNRTGMGDFAGLNETKSYT